MKSPFSLVILLLAALPWLPLSAAQTDLAATISELPSCALTCLITAIQKSPCSPTDQKCLCTNEPLQTSVAVCVQKACTLKQALFTKNLTDTSCAVPVRDRSKLYADLSISFGVISAASVLARVLFKAFVTIGELGLDDYFIFITLIVGVPSSVMNVRGLAANGLGRDVWKVPFDQITEFVRVFYFMEILYFLQVALLKLSILFFYRRIFPAKMVKRIIWATVAFDCVFGTVFMIVAVFQCRPINFYWNRWDGEHKGQCLNINAMGWSNAVISIALDIWMLAIPLSQLVNLKLHWKKKIGVGLMFGVGTFVTVVSILRLSSLVHFASSSNPTWDQWDVANWSTIEINVGMMCACMPALRVILVRCFPKIMGTSTNGRKGYYDSRSDYRSGRNNTRPMDKGSPGSSASVPSDKKNIMYSKSYNVEYEDHDETRLVPMVPLKDLEADSTNNRSRASDIHM